MLYGFMLMEVVASGTVAGTLFASSTPFMIGNDPRLLYAQGGRLDEMVTVGTAQYGGAFSAYCTIRTSRKF